eukprot:TRINITY_DN13730_c0_g2_i1.p1 TRINITY_DN13730_c0_g2~~TRINITY_DN13730_c0_g2_i1.p1  ORF type:complete len:127 (+),score=20.53 TRINITY_DN13730_c0_g2_i1:170-550(+)
MQDIQTFFKGSLDSFVRLRELLAASANSMTYNLPYQPETIYSLIGKEAINNPLVLRALDDIKKFDDSDGQRGSIIHVDKESVQLLDQQLKGFIDILRVKYQESFAVVISFSEKTYEFRPYTVRPPN